MSFSRREELLLAVLGLVLLEQQVDVAVDERQRRAQFVRNVVVEVDFLSCDPLLVQPLRFRKLQRFLVEFGAEIELRDQNGERQCRQNIERIGPSRQPRRSLDADVDACFGAPDAVAVLHLEPETVAPRRKVRIGGPPMAARFDPVLVEAFEPVGVAELARMVVVDSGVVDAERILPVREDHFVSEGDALAHGRTLRPRNDASVLHLEILQNDRRAIRVGFYAVGADAVHP